MSQNEPRPELADPRPQDFTPMGESFGQVPPSNMPVPSDGSTNIEVHGSIITAQRVAVPRDHNRILQKLKTLCGIMGKEYVYSWQVNDRARGGKVTIEGPSIKLANDLAREYGNCIVDVRVQDFPGYWLFYARFIDLETGFSMTRSFQQRKGQDTGMKDKDRAADLVFQIGQSKAIRNVVVNALSTYTDYMVEEAKKNLLVWVENNQERAGEYIEQVLQRHSIDVKRVEATVGRTRDKWTVRDLAKVLMECRGIAENLTVAEDVYPPIEGKKAEPEKEDAKPKAAAKKAPAKKAEAKKESAKKEEPDEPDKQAKKPEKEPEPEKEDEQPEADHSPDDPAPETEEATDADGDDDDGKPDTTETDEFGFDG